VRPTSDVEPRPALQRGVRVFAGRAAFGLYRSLTRTRDKVFSLAWAGSFAGYGPRSVIQLPVRIRGERRIAVGADVFIGAGSWLQVLGEQEGKVAIVIGDGTSIAGSCVISSAISVCVGANVLMARNVYIADHSHGFERRDQPVLDQGISRVSPVEIGDGSWLGQNVFVGPGVRIGPGAVIGANSVVLADVPAHTIAVGAPARSIRSVDRQDAGASSS
jgi:acetyltransferase-like isoleucine patch superfamily enzyme